MPFTLQWQWLRSAVKKHRVLAVAVMVALALAAYAAPAPVDPPEWRERAAWGVSMVLAYATWRQYRTGTKKDADAEFTERVTVIAKPAETHAKLCEIDARICEGFERTDIRFGELGERVARIEGGLEEQRRNGEKDRRLGASDRRPSFGEVKV